MKSLFSPRVPILSRPRDYQTRDLQETLRLWSTGSIGTLTRAATGTGKTFMACQKLAEWLSRGDDYHGLVISYEQQLVDQFAEEIRDFLGIDPGIEMGESRCSPSALPRIIVASRQSLLRQEGASGEQAERLAELGVTTGLTGLTSRKARQYIRLLEEDQRFAESIHDDWARECLRAEFHEGHFSRVHKFPWPRNWLVIFDEAHRHAYHLKSVQHIVDWFGRNPVSRRTGMTATPKRFDGVSLGDVMFPAIALDYPLYHPTMPSALTDGWAVPYVQRYIQVSSIDFREIKRIAGDYDPAALEDALNTEATLAELIEPMLDMCGHRPTIAFCPGVKMARSVAAYLNARRRCRCECGKESWHGIKLLSESAAKCPGCSRPLGGTSITEDSDSAVPVWGEMPRAARNECYAGHNSGKFQFLCVCNLCREGYNSRVVSCIAVFRPVSKKASSLAEQMKGRGCRPLPGVVDGLDTREERLAAIAASAKADCLIIDLVGVTGLVDCASTVSLYAEGLPDEVVEIAEKQLAQEEGSVLDAVARAKEIASRDQEARRELAEAAARSKAGVEVKYEAVEAGSGPGTIRADQSIDGSITDPQIKFIRFLGMSLYDVSLSVKQAGRLIGLLKARKTPAEAARLMGLRDFQWGEVQPTVKQLGKLRSLGIRQEVQTPYEASQLIDARLDPEGWANKKAADLVRAKGEDDLAAVRADLQLVRRLLPRYCFDRVCEAGIEAKKSLDSRGGACVFCGRFDCECI